MGFEEKISLRKFLRDDSVISVKSYSTYFVIIYKKKKSSTLKIYLLDQCLEKLSLITFEIHINMHY